MSATSAQGDPDQDRPAATGSPDLAALVEALRVALADLHERERSLKTDEALLRLALQAGVQTQVPVKELAVAATLSRARAYQLLHGTRSGSGPTALVRATPTAVNEPDPRQRRLAQAELLGQQAGSLQVVEDAARQMVAGRASVKDAIAARDDALHAAITGGMSVQEASEITALGRRRIEKILLAARGLRPPSGVDEREGPLP